MFFISNGFNLNQKCLGGEIAAGSQLFHLSVKKILAETAEIAEIFFRILPFLLKKNSF